MLWNAVRVTTGTTNGQISALLLRSARCNLSLEIEGALDPSSLISAELAIGQYQRVVRLDVYLTADVWPLQITRRLTDASIWPELQYLALSHYVQDLEQKAFVGLRISAPQLHTLDLYRVAVRDWSSLNEAFPNLENFTAEWIPSAASLLPVLPSFLALRTLKLLVPQETLSADVPPSFSLPHLHSLEIDAMELRADVLSVIVSNNSPQLTSLRVRFHRVDMRQSAIELSSPRLTDLRIENVNAASADLPLPICFRPVPHALNTLELIGVIDDIPAMIAPSLRRLELAYTNIDVERLGSALSQCQDVGSLVFTALRCTSAVVRSPPPTAVLPRLTYAVHAQGPGELLDENVQQLFVRLLPPTVVQMYIFGTPGPSSDDLRPVLEDIEFAAPTQLSLEITDGALFSLKDDVRDYTRMFDIDSGAEYLEILLSRPTFCAHIRKLEVEVVHAAQIVIRCAGSLPLLEELGITYPVDVDQPYDKNKIQDALQDLVESVPAPIACPRFKTLAIQVYRAPITVLLPVALKRALAALFSSDETCIEYTDLLEWVE
ncbi:hypothetical protein EXIGLDRAFT_722992 [Exidia glandulosa HHB12029]|uniref:F-box domain-containing protein n=1 Tax=Exidia glandulosa HHB12029 TaxID=1314781 RepID=A0A165F126_EXIGL|nr:hypothetical protein EXIGLDRAFT_722992 [Exidia glandulosa HHB12029]